MSKLRRLAVTLAAVLAGCGSIAPLQLNSLPTATVVRQAATFDHSILDGLLQRHVDDQGLVDYPGLAHSQAVLESYLESLAMVDPQVLTSEAERKAYWINAYNAITLAGILHHYPTRSIRDLPGFWQNIKTNCGGKLVSLDQIEHQILRPLGDPRVHMAINCASMSCPQLANRAYTGFALDDQLDTAVRAFLSSPQRNRFNDAEHRAHLSMIFSWFETDFEVAPYGSVRGFVRRYAEPRSWLIDDFAMDQMPYDWSLNARPPAQP